MGCAVAVNRAESRMKGGTMDQKTKMDIECAAFLKEKVAECYSENRLDTEKVLKDVSDVYGYARVASVIAYNIQQHSHDGRILSRNREWAAKIHSDACEYCDLDSVHTGLLNLLADRIRSEESEFIGQCIDIFEDFITTSGVKLLPSKDKAAITGQDYENLAGKIKELLLNWAYAG